MTAEYREVREYRDCRATAEDLAVVARLCGFRVTEISPGFARLRSRMSLRSFGERIEIHLSELDRNLVADVHSVCIVATTIEDYAKNQQNCHRFLETLGKHLNAAESSTVPVCTNCGYPLTGINGDVCPECGVSADGDRSSVIFRKKLRQAAVACVAGTGVVVGLLSFAHELGVLPGVFVQYTGLRGALHLLSIEAITIFGVILFARAREQRRKR